MDTSHTWKGIILGARIINTFVARAADDPTSLDWHQEVKDIYIYIYKRIQGEDMVDEVEKDWELIWK